MSEAAKKWMVRAGWIVSALVTALFLFSASGKVMQTVDVKAALGTHLGYPENVIFPIGVLELCCLLLYLVPRTASLGAVLLTGYLGGALASHLRVGDSIALVVVIGAFMWTGALLRDERIRSLLPIQR